MYLKPPAELHLKRQFSIKKRFVLFGHNICFWNFCLPLQLSMELTENYLLEIWKGHGGVVSSIIASQQESSGFKSECASLSVLLD